MIGGAIGDDVATGAAAAAAPTVAGMAGRTVGAAVTNGDAGFAAVTTAKVRDGETATLLLLVLLLVAGGPLVAPCVTEVAAGLRDDPVSAAPALGGRSLRRRHSSLSSSCEDADDAPLSARQRRT